MQNLIALIASKDERVALLACQAVLDRAFGRSSMVKPGDGAPPRPSVLDFSYLSNAEVTTLFKLMQKAKEPSSVAYSTGG